MPITYLNNSSTDTLVPAEICTPQNVTPSPKVSKKKKKRNPKKPKTPLVVSDNAVTEPSPPNLPPGPDSALERKITDALKQALLVVPEITDEQLRIDLANLTLPPLKLPRAPLHQASPTTPPSESLTVLDPSPDALLDFINSLADEESTDFPIRTGDSPSLSDREDALEEYIGTLLDASGLFQALDSESGGDGSQSLFDQLVESFVECRERTVSSPTKKSLKGAKTQSQSVVSKVTSLSSVSELEAALAVVKDQEKTLERRWKDLCQQNSQWRKELGTLLD